MLRLPVSRILTVIRIARYTGIIVSFMFSAPLTAQSVRFIDKSDFEATQPLTNTLDLLESELLLEELTYVGLLEATHQNISALYYAMHHASTDAGANIYKVHTFAIDTLGSAFYCTWELFAGGDSVAALNQSLKVQNTAFVFAPFDEGVDIKINGLKQFLKPATYFEHVLNTEKALKINHGGVTGITYMAKTKKDGSNVYLTTGKGSAGPMIGAGGIGISFSSGSLQPVEEPLAVFMTQVYRRYP
jgi:hypothetical protein